MWHLNVRLIKSLKIAVVFASDRFDTILNLKQ